MRPAQRLGEHRLVLEADAKRFRAEPSQRKHLSGDLEHRRLGAKRKRLLRSPKREAVIAKLRGVHLPNLAQQLGHVMTIGGLKSPQGNSPTSPSGEIAPSSTLVAPSYSDSGPGPLPRRVLRATREPPSSAAPARAARGLRE